MAVTAQPAVSPLATPRPSPAAAQRPRTHPTRWAAGLARLPPARPSPSPSARPGRPRTRRTPQQTAAWRAATPGAAHAAAQQRAARAAGVPCGAPIVSTLASDMGDAGRGAATHRLAAAFAFPVTSAVNGAAAAPRSARCTPCAAIGGGALGRRRRRGTRTQAEAAPSRGHAQAAQSARRCPHGARGYRSRRRQWRHVMTSAVHRHNRVHPSRRSCVAAVRASKRTPPGRVHAAAVAAGAEREGAARRAACTPRAMVRPCAAPSAPRRQLTLARLATRAGSRRRRPLRAQAAIQVRTRLPGPFPPPPARHSPALLPPCCFRTERSAALTADGAPASAAAILDNLLPERCVAGANTAPSAHLGRSFSRAQTVGAQEAERGVHCR